MQEIQFDLGRNIVDTAKASGVRSFSTRNIDGFVSYSVNGIPATIPARYTRPGYEVSWQPIFAFTMYTEMHRSPAGGVETVVLQLDKHFETHAQAQAFVEQTLAQFQKGKWQRYYEPTWDALLTGRSSFLDEHGKVTTLPKSIDPAYKIDPSDWVVLLARTAYWRWVGDGVLAQLSVSAYPGIGTTSPTYSIFLHFNLLDVKLEQDEKNAAKERKEGDAKGWKSTADYEKSKRDRLAVLKVLEANAIKRGDAVVAPH